MVTPLIIAHNIHLSLEYGITNWVIHIGFNISRVFALY
jgi:hypothetical protein